MSNHRVVFALGILLVLLACFVMVTRAHAGTDPAAGYDFAATVGAGAPEVAPSAVAAVIALLAGAAIVLLERPGR